MGKTRTAKARPSERPRPARNEEEKPEPDAVPSPVRAVAGDVVYRLSAKASHVNMREIFR